MLLAVGLATACRPEDKSSAASNAVASEVQTLTVGALDDDFGLQLNRPRLGIYPLNTGICEPLMKLSNDLQAVPHLATRAEYLGDNTYRFTLRRGVLFHDASPLDANAIKSLWIMQSG